MSVARPKDTRSILHINAGATATPQLLALLCNHYRSFVGLIVREPNKIEVERYLKLGTPEEQIAKITKIVAGTQKFPRTFTFGQSPEEFDEDECQPWIAIRDSKGNPILGVSIEGDFINRESKEGYSEAYMVMTEYLGPKLEEVYKLSGNNPTKLFEFIASDSFAKDLKLLYGHRAAFAFMPSVGDPILLGNFAEEGKGGGKYPWGACTFSHGYEEEAPAAAPKKEATMANNPPKLSKYEDDPSPAAPVPLPPKESVPRVIPATPTDPVEKVATEIIEDTAVDWSPPISIHGKGLKKAYRDMLGYLPDNWQQRPSFKIKAKSDVEVAKAAEAPKSVQKAVETKTDPKPVLPVIDGRQQSSAVDFIKKHLGDGSAVIPDPLAIQKQEANLAVFSELCLKTGDLNELNIWPVSGIFAFVKQHPEVAALAMIEYRRDRINRLATIKDGEKTLGELAGTDAAPAASPEKTPLAEPAKADPPAMPEPRRAAGGASKYM